MSTSNFAKKIITNIVGNNYKLTQVSDLRKRLPTKHDTWIGTRDLYRNGDLNMRLHAVLSNYVLTESKAEFLLSKSIMEEMIKNDPNIDRETLSGKEFNIFMAKAQAEGFIECVEPPSSYNTHQRKAGTYKIIDSDIVKQIASRIKTSSSSTSKTSPLSTPNSSLEYKNEYKSEPKNEDLYSSNMNQDKNNSWLESSFFEEDSSYPTSNTNFSYSDFEHRVKSKGVNSAEAHDYFEEKLRANEAIDLKQIKEILTNYPGNFRKEKIKDILNDYDSTFNKWRPSGLLIG